jgi:threonine aldolase
MIIDLRSDTVTRPSAGMLEAMSSAPLGDDVYGDDPTVNAFEERVAALFGKEAALFAPTGSMANQLGLRLLVEPGQELLADERAHVVRAELGAAAVFSGITTRTFSTPDSRLSAEQAFSVATPGAGPYLVSTAAIAIENTHNFGGGIIQPIEEIKKLHQLVSSTPIALHLDGARIWNAHVATGISFREFGSYFTTISVCFSKGLGAPIGSALIASRDLIDKARIWRKRYGGGMRQVGLLAAAADYALTNHLDGLADDHRRAKSIAQAIASVDEGLVNLHDVETNIIGINLQRHQVSAAKLAEELKNLGLLSGPLGASYLRLVTHRDIDDEKTNRACEILNQVLRDLL